MNTNNNGDVIEIVPLINDISTNKPITIIDKNKSLITEIPGIKFTTTIPTAQSILHKKNPQLNTQNSRNVPHYIIQPNTIHPPQNIIQPNTIQPPQNIIQPNIYESYLINNNQNKLVGYNNYQAKHTIFKKLNLN